MERTLHNPETLRSPICERLRYTCAGFSVVEMLVTMTVFGIMVATAIPRYGLMAKSFARDSAVKQVDFGVRRAKAEAVANGVRSIVDFSADGSTYTVGIDKLPFSSPPVADQIIINEQLPSGTTANTSTTRLVFDSRGFLVDDSGNPITGSVTFRQAGSTFATGTIYSTGVFLLRVRLTG